MLKILLLMNDPRPYNQLPYESNHFIPNKVVLPSHLVCNVPVYCKANWIGNKIGGWLGNDLIAE